MVRDLIAGDPSTSSIYAVNALDSQYWLYHLAAAALAFPLGPTRANVFILAVVAALYPLSLAALLRAHGRDPRLAVFGAMPFLSRSLGVGFLPFVAAVPIVLYGLAALERYIAEPTRARTVALAVLAVAIFYLHVDAFAVFGLAATVRIVTETFDRTRLVVWCVRSVRLLVFFLPSFVAALTWTVRGSLTVKSDSFGAVVGHLTFSRRVLGLPLWMSDLWTDRIDDASCTMWWGALLALVVFGLSEFRTMPLRVLVARYTPLLVAVSLFFILPFRVGAAGMLNVRIATFVALFAVLLVPRTRAWVTTAALATAALATAIQAGDSFVNVRRIAKTGGADVGLLLAKVPARARLLTLVFAFDTDGAVYSPWLRIGQWHVVDGGRVAGPSFAEIAHWSVRYERSQAPPERPLFWHPCAFRNAVEGRYYDAVLVRGDIDPFRSAPPGPVFHRVATEGRFSLYLRDEVKTWPGNADEDLGPCAPPDALPRGNSAP